MAHHIFQGEMRTEFQEFRVEIRLLFNNLANEMNHVNERFDRVEADLNGICGELDCMKARIVAK